MKAIKLLFVVTFMFLFINVVSGWGFTDFGVEAYSCNWDGAIQGHQCNRGSSGATYCDDLVDGDLGTFAGIENSGTVGYGWLTYFNYTKQYFGTYTINFTRYRPVKKSFNANDKYEFTCYDGASWIFLTNETTANCALPLENYTVQIPADCASQTPIQILWNMTVPTASHFQITANIFEIFLEPVGLDLSIDGVDYTTPTIETQSEDLSVNITFDSSSYTPVVNLVYDGTSYLATTTDTGDVRTYTRNLIMPLVTGSTNKTFYWDVQDVGGTYNSTSYNQTIGDLPTLSVGTSCGNETAINFTAKDEGNLTDINVTVDYNFVYGLTGGNTSGFRIFGTIDTAHEFYLCINTTIAESYEISEGEIQYTAENYVDRRYYLYEGTVLTSATNNITLYDLLSADQNSFKLEIEDTSLNPYVNKYTALIRWYPDLNQYNIVDMGLTDEVGSTVIHVRTEDVDYRIGVYERNGTLIKLADPIRMTCLVSPCTYTLKIAPTEIDYTSFLNIDYTFGYNSTTGVWTFVFSDTSQTTNTINLTVYKVTGTSVYPVCTNLLTATSGAVTCNTSAYSGNLRGVVSRTASPGVELAQLMISTTTTAFSSTFGLWISILIGIPIIFIFAFMSPLGAVLGGIIALIPALYLGAISFTVMGGIAILGGIVMHFLKRIN